MVKGVAAPASAEARSPGDRAVLVRVRPRGTVRADAARGVRLRARPARPCACRGGR